MTLKTDSPFETMQANLPGCRSLAVIRRTRTTDPEEVLRIGIAGSKKYYAGPT